MLKKFKTDYKRNCRKSLKPTTSGIVESDRASPRAMHIVSWNVAGLRAMLKKGNLQELLETRDFDIVCLQETKAEEHQVKLPDEITTKYPYRFWNSTRGTTQRKGLSGTTIWSKNKPLKQIPPPEIDEEGRITTLEYDNFIICCVYTPNSQKIETPRFEFRTKKWDQEFRKYIIALKNIKPTIVTGDFNVAHLDIDINNVKRNKNKAPGFYDDERTQFQEHLDSGFIDVFRHFHPTQEGAYTYWNQLRPANRENNVGWRIDYFLSGGESSRCAYPQTPELTASGATASPIKDCGMLPDVYGSDHCPLYLELG